MTHLVYNLNVLYSHKKAPALFKGQVRDQAKAVVRSCLCYKNPLPHLSRGQKNPAPKRAGFFTICRRT